MEAPSTEGGQELPAPSFGSIITKLSGEVKKDGNRGFTVSDNPTSEEIAEANRQYDAVVAKYKDSPLWMKAPNGQPTKLTERQWVQVRTENFKQWFGDWEKAGIRERLENQEPVTVSAEYNLSSPAERRKAAMEMGIDTVADTPIGKVIIDSSSVRSTLQHGNTNAKLDVLKRIKDVAEVSTFLDLANDLDGKDHKNFYLATRIKRGNNQNELVGCPRFSGHNVKRTSACSHTQSD